MSTAAHEPGRTAYDAIHHSGDSPMPQFRKKPVVIQAEQWFPDRIVKGVRWEQESRDDGEFLKPYVITAHEQRAYLAPGDWIIPEPKPNRFYPCKPDIFAATYDTIEAAYDDIRELRELSEKCPLPLKVEGECLIVLDSDRRRFTDLGTPEMAQFVLASVNYVRSLLAQPVTPSVSTPTGEGEECGAERVYRLKVEWSKRADLSEGDHAWLLTMASRAIRAEAALPKGLPDLAHPQQGGERDEAPVWGTAALLRAASINLRWAEDGYSVVLRCKGLGDTKKLHDGLKAFAEPTVLAHPYQGGERDTSNREVQS